jgi:polyisoprenyl-phosphate glycosyltransferase
MSVSPDRPPLCSIILTVYNEVLNLPTLYDRLVAMAEKESVAFEFIFVDDGSRDRSFEILQELNARDKRVKVLRLSRNFGSHTAVVAGLREASGDCAVLMASDHQDPPELIADFLQRWREGYHVVWAARTGRKDPFFRRLSARLFYAVIRKLAIPDYPKFGTGSFCLIGRPVIDALNLLEERNRVTFELIVWCGFVHATVPYERLARFKGSQSWTFGRNIKAAIDSILALSTAPIRWMTLFGFFVAMTSFLLGLYVLVYALIHGFGTVGWTSTMVSIHFLGGAQLFCLGFLGEYLWRILQETRRRPLYLLRDRVGQFGQSPGSSPQESANEHKLTS